MASQAATQSASTGKAANICLYPAEHDRYSMYIPEVHVAGVLLKLPLLSSQHYVSQLHSVKSRSARGANTRANVTSCKCLHRAVSIFQAVCMMSVDRTSKSSKMRMYGLPDAYGDRASCQRAVQIMAL